MRNDSFRKTGQVLSLPFAFVPLRTLLVGFLVVSAIGSALWVNPSYAQTPQGSYDEAEAQGIDEMLMCPVCPAESIDQAQVPLARQMRQRVREMLTEGASRQEILDYFADRYGQSVLASPPKSGFNLLAWVLPVFGVVAALVAGLLVLRAMTGRNDGPAGEGVAMDPQDADLEPYLAAVDRSLAIEADEEDTGESSAEVQ